jgi:acetyltransferase-like isoleucine patch superfamily enzyme
MAYSSQQSANKRGFLFSLRKKTGRMLAGSFPLNRIRVSALRWAGYQIGHKVYIGTNFTLAAMNSEIGDDLQIGDRVAIGPNVTLVLSSDANYSRLIEKIPPIRGFIKLGNDCWIGAGVIILPNVVIGECAVVGAGSVVTRDVEPYTIVAGVPAKHVKTIEKF